LGCICIDASAFGGLLNESGKPPALLVKAEESGTGDLQKNIKINQKEKGKAALRQPSQNTNFTITKGAIYKIFGYG